MPSKTNSTERWLICRPRGGLNDVLCQIENCWQYAERFDRTLVVDTARSNLAAAFSEFFEPLDHTKAVVFSADEDLIEKMNEAGCFPASAQGRLWDYSDARNSKYHDVEPSSVAGLSFDFEQDYAEQVLLLYKSGGGIRSFELLNRVRFAPKLAEIVSERTRHLTFDYAAIHVRNTDLRTDYHRFFRRISNRVRDRPLLVCSDDSGVLSDAKSFFTTCNVFTVSTIPQTNGLPVHHPTSLDSAEEMTKSTIGAFVDLIALGKATRYYYTCSDRLYPSGFSRLAGYLCDNKAIIDTLLTGAIGNHSARTGGAAVFVPPISLRVCKAIPRFVRNLFP